MKPGVYADLSNAAYHGGPGTSKSGLDIVRKSLLHFKCARDAANDNTPREPTAAQAFGSAFHSIVLEPHLFVRDCCLALRRGDVPQAIDERETLVQMVADLNATRKPKLATTGSKAELVERIASSPEFTESNDGVTVDILNGETGALLKQRIERINTGRDGLLPTSGTRHELAAILRANGHPVTLWSDVQAEWMANNGHRTVLDEEQWKHLHGMRDAVMAHPYAAKLLAMPGATEQSYYWIDERTGLLMRCRPDRRTDSGIIIDLKSTEDASPEEFARSIANYRYHVQEPLYVDGTNEAIRQAQLDIPLSRFMVFIAVEKKPPYAVGVYKLDMESVDIGRMEYREDMTKIAKAVATDEWPGYGDTVQSISLPAWKKAQALGV